MGVAGGGVAAVKGPSVITAHSWLYLSCEKLPGKPVNWNQLSGLEIQTLSLVMFNPSVGSFSFMHILKDQLQDWSQKRLKARSRFKTGCSRRPGCDKRRDPIAVVKIRWGRWRQQLRACIVSLLRRILVGGPCSL